MAFTICPAEVDITSPTPYPESSQLSPTPCMEPLPEPIADTEPKPAAMLVPDTWHKPITAPEPEPGGKSHQVCEMAISSVPVGVLVKFEGMDWSPTHIPMPEGEWQLASVGFCEDLEEDNSCNLPSPLQVSCVSNDLTKPPSPTSSTKESQALPLLAPVSHSAPPSLVPLVVMDLPSSPQIHLGCLILLVHLWPSSPDSNSAPPPFGYTLALCFLISTVGHQSTGSTRLSHPSGSALVRLYTVPPLDSGPPAQQNKNYTKISFLFSSRKKKKT